MLFVLALTNIEKININMKIEPFRIRVTPEQSKIIQETLFENGYSWRGSPAQIKHLDKDRLIFDSSRGLRHSWGDKCLYAPLITFKQFLSMYKKKDFNKIEYYKDLPI